MKDYPDGLDGDEVDVTVIREPWQTRTMRYTMREEARRRQRREARFSIAFVIMMVLVAVLPILWASIR